MTMFRWLQSLFSSPAEAQPQPAVEAVPSPPPAPAAPAPQPGTSPVSFEQLERIHGAWNAWLFDRADGGLELSDAETRVLEALATIAGSQQSGAALVRRMPGLVPQLLQSLRSETFSGSALSRTIASDPVLVAAVVRLANSCYQGTGQSITSVEQAVILIGQSSTCVRGSTRAGWRRTCGRIRSAARSPRAGWPVPASNRSMPFSPGCCRTWA
jgi:hypothetical protein